MVTTLMDSIKKSILKGKLWVQNRIKWIGCAFLSGGISGIAVLYFAGRLAPYVSSISKMLESAADDRDVMEMITKDAGNYGVYAVIFMASFLLIMFAPMLLFGSYRKALISVCLFVGMITEGIVIISCAARGEIFPFAFIISWAFLTYVLFLGFIAIRDIYLWMKKEDGDVDLGKLVFVWGVIIFILGRIGK